MAIDLTIIIPVYRVSLIQFRRCLQSILRQEVGAIQYEIFVVVDGASDNKQLLDSGVLRSDAHIRYAIRPHGGEAAARNYGMQHAKGRWFLFVDADDCLADKAIAHFMDPDVLYIGNDNNRQVDLVVSNHIRRTGHRADRIIYYARRQYWNDDSCDFLNDVLSVGSDQGTVWSKLFRTAFVKDSGEQFNPLLVNGVDQEFMTRLVLHSPVICAIPQITYLYIYNPESVVRKFDSRYSDKVLRTLKVVKHDIIHAGLMGHFQQTYLNYCCDRLLLIIMNYLCNPHSDLSYMQRRQKFLQIIRIEPMMSALRMPDLSQMSLARRLVILLARGHCFALINMIAWLRNRQRSLQLKSCA